LKEKIGVGPKNELNANLNLFSGKGAGVNIFFKQKSKCYIPRPRPFPFLTIIFGDLKLYLQIVQSQSLILHKKS
jgi:hypothetical protein